MNDDLPSEVQQLLVQHIDTTEQVEVLLMLHGSPTRAWTVDEVYAKVLTSRDSIARRLEDLCAKGLAVARPEGGPGYQYQPKTSELDAAVLGLARLYRERMHKVIECIYQKPSSTVRSFADAFRLRKE